MWAVLPSTRAATLAPPTQRTSRALPRPVLHAERRSAAASRASLCAEGVQHVVDRVEGDDVTCGQQSLGGRGGDVASCAGDLLLGTRCGFGCQPRHERAGDEDGQSDGGSGRGQQDSKQRDGRGRSQRGYRHRQHDPQPQVEHRIHVQHKPRQQIALRRDVNPPGANRSSRPVILARVSPSTRYAASCPTSRSAYRNTPRPTPNARTATIGTINNNTGG